MVTVLTLRFQFERVRLLIQSRTVAYRPEVT